MQSRPDFKSQVNWRNTLLSVAFNAALAGVFLFARYVVGIGDASIFARMLFYAVWGLLAAFGLAVMGSYFFYMIFRRGG
jgi:hypothetical protein